jgi:hypothetical protein
MTYGARYIIHRPLLYDALHWQEPKVHFHELPEELRAACMICYIRDPLELGPEDFLRMGSAEDVCNDQARSTYTIKGLCALDSRFNANHAGSSQLLWQLVEVDFRFLPVQGVVETSLGRYKHLRHCPCVRNPPVLVPKDHEYRDNTDVFEKPYGAGEEALELFWLDKFF